MFGLFPFDSKLHPLSFRNMYSNSVRKGSSILYVTSLNIFSFADATETLKNKLQIEHDVESSWKVLQKGKTKSLSGDSMHVDHPLLQSFSFSC